MILGYWKLVLETRVWESVGTFSSASTDFEIAMVLVESQAYLALFNLLFQHCHRIAEILGAIVDRRIEVRYVALIAYRDLRLDRHCDHRRQPDRKRQPRSPRRLQNCAVQTMHKSGNDFPQSHLYPPACRLTEADKWTVLGGWHMRPLQVWNRTPTGIV